MVEINSSTKRAILGFFSSLVLLCGISACSDGGSDVPDGGGNSTIAASPDEPAPARPESPLDEYLSLILGAHDPVESARIGQRRAIREEELIAECMHEAGFGYIPYPEAAAGLG